VSWIYEGLPNTIMVEGKPFLIKTGFKNWAKFADMIVSEMSEPAKLRLALDWFGEEKPSNTEAAFYALLDFLVCGKPVEPSTDKVVFDLEQDWEYVYASFRQVYRINLLKDDDLHWWEFQALLKGLINCKLNDVINVRDIDINDYKDPKMRKKIREMQKAYTLEKNKNTEADADAVFGMFG